MYSGTLISDLKLAVERAEWLAEMRAEQMRMAEKAELRSMFEMRNLQQTRTEQIFAGAA
jgi:hypothetical protein